MANLIKGQPYNKKKDFDIFFPASLKSDQIVKGELYSFFNDESGKDDNHKHPDGFVYEIHAKHQLIPPGEKTDLHRHIFVRIKNTSDFEYLGKSVREEHFSPKHNKAFWKNSVNQCQIQKEDDFKDCSLPE